MNKVLFLIIGVSLGACLQAQPDPKDLMQKSRKQTLVSGMESKTTLEIHDGKGNSRIRETSMVSRIFPDGTEKRLLVFLSPADVKGTAMLIFDYSDKEDDLWIYLPALRKSRKIVASEKSKSFMGSEFTNADLSAGNPDEWIYALDGSEVIGDTDCWKIRMTPASDKIAAENGIKDKVNWVGKQDLMPRRVVYNGNDGKPLRELNYLAFKKMDPAKNQYTVTLMEVKNLKNSRFSRMIMEDIKVNPQVKEEFFTLQYIEKQ